MHRRRFSIPVGLAGLSLLSCQMGEEDDEIGYGCVFVDAGSSCPTAAPTWLDVHSDNPFLFGGTGNYGYYGYYGYGYGYHYYYYEYGYSEQPEEDLPECGISVGQDFEQTYTSWWEFCRPTGIEYVGRRRPREATLGCPIPADTDLCCYQFSCEMDSRW